MITNHIVTVGLKNGINGNYLAVNLTKSLLYQIPKTTIEPDIATFVGGKLNINQSSL